MISNAISSPGEVGFNFLISQMKFGSCIILQPTPGSAVKRATQHRPVMRSKPAGAPDAVRA